MAKTTSHTSEPLSSTGMVLKQSDADWTEVFNELKTRGQNEGSSLLLTLINFEQGSTIDPFSFTYQADRLDLFVEECWIVANIHKGCCGH